MLLAAALLAILGAVVVYDLVQRRHAVLRNFPVVGHFRYLLEAVGPELRQYIVTDNDEERPFSRDQRRWIYASSKKENNYFGFGTDNDLEQSPNYLIIKHCSLGSQVGAEHPGGEESLGYPLPAAKVLGGARGRRFAFRPASVVNVSGMSFGSLSGRAVEALNGGSKLAGCLQNTGEGGVSSHHLHGGDLICQIGTGYFGCRDDSGSFDLGLLKEMVASGPVRALEVKLSQGAKPGLGGLLPKEKITAEIASIRKISRDCDCVSPPFHQAFTGPDGLLDFVEMLAEETGLPVGIKSAVGQLAFWTELAQLMSEGDRGVDFIAIDGGEGGTGAGPLAFTDHVALPFKLAFSRVFRVFSERDLAERVVFIGSGKLGFPEKALFAFGLGCDMVNVGREAMISLGCIQAQRCHTGRCPTGVATQNRWLMRGLDPELKAARLANYLVTMRKNLLQLCHACGVAHPAFISNEHFEILDDGFTARTLADVFNYEERWSLPSQQDLDSLLEAMAEPSPSPAHTALETS